MKLFSSNLNSAPAKPSRHRFRDLAVQPKKAQQFDFKNNCFISLLLMM